MMQGRLGVVRGRSRRCLSHVAATPTTPDAEQALQNANGILDYATATAPSNDLPHWVLRICDRMGLLYASHQKEQTIVVL